MKITLVILGILMIAFVVFQIYLAVSTASVENKPFEVVKKEGELEIRFYPSVKIAQFTSRAGSYKTTSSSGFRKLAGYIFGGNEKKESIAMTSPVQMDINDSSSTMSFMMPSVYNTKELPTPLDSNVKLTRTEDEYVAVISFSGFANDELISTYSNMLARILKEKNLTAIGNYRYLGYNPPYQLLGRKNEVIVRVQWEM
jgi:hypothetical protein